jgi:cell division initiation protein
MIAPADIDTRQFSSTRLKEGYDQNEVDDFLDLVARDYRTILDKLNRLERENESLRRASSGAETQVIQQPSAIMEKVLLVAEQTAQQHVEEAKAEADEIVRAAGAKGARVIEEANDAAERIKNDGYAEKYRKFEELDNAYKQTQAALEELQRKGKQARDAMTNAISYYDRGVNS